MIYQYNYYNSNYKISISRCHNEQFDFIKVHHSVSLLWLFIDGGAQVEN